MRWRKGLISVAVREGWSTVFTGITKEREEDKREHVRASDGDVDEIAWFDEAEPRVQGVQHVVRELVLDRLSLPSGVHHVERLF